MILYWSTRKQCRFREYNGMIFWTEIKSITIGQSNIDDDHCPILIALLATAVMYLNVLTGESGTLTMNDKQQNN